MEKSGFYKAIIKDNRDKLGMGRVRVYIPEFGGNPGDENTWYTASYMSPYAGQTNPYQNAQGGKTEIESQDSYGIWANSYHPENEVIVSFVDGDAGLPVIIGGLFGQNMTSSIGGYPSNRSTEDKIDGVNPPTVEYNKRDDDINPRSPKRPKRDILTQQLWRQGLFRDFIRGQTDTSPQRDPVPQFQSFKTPAGGMFVIDDGKVSTGGAGGRPVPGAQGASPYMRMRTKGGTQFLINSNCGFIYMNSKNGSSWFQIANNGIQAFTEGDMNVRAQGNYNQRSDGTHNIEVMGDMNIRSIGPINLETDSGYDIKSKGDILVTTKGDHSVKSESDQKYDSQNEYTENINGSIFEDPSGSILDNVIPGIPAAGASIAGTTPAANRVMSFHPNMFENLDPKAFGPTTPSAEPTTLPAGDFVTHEPWANQPNACGKPSSAAEEGSPEPTEEQPLGDGTTEEVPVEDSPEVSNPGELHKPTDGSRITSDFGGRDSPGGIGSTNHQGVDIGVPVGTPVYAVEDGVVGRAGWQNPNNHSAGYGQRIYVDHGNGYQSVSGHLSQITVQPGQTVHKGDIIGYSGSTGASTGPHLHFGVSHNGTYVDPLPYINGERNF